MLAVAPRVRISANLASEVACASVGRARGADQISTAVQRLRDSARGVAGSGRELTHTSTSLAQSGQELYSVVCI